MTMDQPHRRYDPLADKWILLSPHRLSRPWQGEEGEPEPSPPAHDPDCYLCPGNKRATGDFNPDYNGVYVFPNDFPALKPTSADIDGGTADLFQSEAANGECHVVCFSPDHGKSLAELSHEGRLAVIETWCRESEKLGQQYPNVQIFENKGAMMGCSNPHPHGQIWANDYLPDIVKNEDQTQLAYAQKNDRSMLLAVAEAEIEAEDRVVAKNDQWVAVVPWWASWPFETLLLPRFAVSRLPELDGDQQQALAEILGALTVKYDNLFRCSFPYSMGWHGAPFGQKESGHWQLHAHFYPPLLRSASVRKFMVGYEMMAEAQRDLLPERAAEMLRNVSTTHYRQDA
ncbi:MAG: galactose-1-phosphate uridylyltransferase [Parasphingorhabdus sp.]